jgi:hypothetical protein
MMPPATICGPTAGTATEADVRYAGQPLIWDRKETTVASKTA